MKTTSGHLSDYQIRAIAANGDSAESSVGNCTKDAFLVGERTLFEVCAVAVLAPKAGARNETELDALRPTSEVASLIFEVLTR